MVKSSCAKAVETSAMAIRYSSAYFRMVINFAPKVLIFCLPLSCYCIILQNMESLVEWLSSHALPCFHKQLFGFSCPMCGFQRGIILLLQGDVLGCIVQFPPIVAWFLTLLACILLFATKKMTKRIGWIIVWCNLAVFLFNWIYQNVAF